MDESEQSRKWGGGAAGGFIIGLVTTTVVWFALLLVGLVLLPVLLSAAILPTDIYSLIRFPQVIIIGFASKAANFIGITQFAYVVPLWRWARRRRDRGFAKGLVVSASLVFILDSACVGLLSASRISSFSFFDFVLILFLVGLAVVLSGPILHWAVPIYRWARRRRTPN